MCAPEGAPLQPGGNVPPDPPTALQAPDVRLAVPVVGLARWPPGAHGWVSDGHRQSTRGADRRPDGANLPVDHSQLTPADASAAARHTPLNASRNSGLRHHACNQNADTTPLGFQRNTKDATNAALRRQGRNLHLSVYLDALNAHLVRMRTKKGLKP